MKRIYEVTELYDYIGSSICHSTEDSAIYYAETVNHHGDDYYYYIEQNNGYIVRFYSFNYKKAYKQLVQYLSELVNKLR